MRVVAHASRGAAFDLGDDGRRHMMSVLYGLQRARRVRATCARSAGNYTAWNAVTLYVLFLVSDAPQNTRT